MFYWENFGPTHVDRCDAVARAMPRQEILGIELNPTSSTYSWRPEAGRHFVKRTLHNDEASWGALRTAFELVRARSARARTMCSYATIMSRAFKSQPC